MTNWKIVFETYNKNLCDKYTMPNPVEFISNLLKYTTIHYSSPSTAFPLRICKTRHFHISNERYWSICTYLSDSCDKSSPGAVLCHLAAIRQRERSWGQTRLNSARTLIVYCLYENFVCVTFFHFIIIKQ